MTNENLKNILREIIGEVLDEITGTGSVAGYQTPFAFAGKGDTERKKKIAKRSIPGGKVVDDEENPDEITEGDRLPIITRGTVAEGRGRYHNFKTDPTMKTHRKISYGIKEAHSMLHEVEFLVGLCERLKTESGTSNTDLWSRTKKDIVNIHGRLKEIAKRINRLNK